jgi:ubiquinone/menaquinone biosynthesis C-methylase UbiE
MSRPDYGLDAPPVIRNLALAAIALAIGAQLLPHRLMWFAWGTGALCGVEAALMVWASRIGKIWQRERLLDQVQWPGVSRVLDVGCGRGLLANGAARRLGPDGRVVAVDLWQTADLAGNHPGAAAENARKEEVSDRVRIVTGDMRALPLADRSVDVVLSSLAIHNVQGEAGRTRAIAEIARVLRPGGVVVLQDFRNIRRYAAELRSNGVTVERVSALQFRIFPPARFIVAKRPLRPS